MKWQRILMGALVSALLLLGLLAGLSAAQGPQPPRPLAPEVALGTAFTYQGQLMSSGEPVNDDCEMAFRLYDSAGGGSELGAVTHTVPISDGLFTVSLDFGAAFDGQARWLGVRVNCPGDGSFSDLDRQPLSAAPYAQYSLSAGALQGHPVTTTAPDLGEVLEWDGSVWGPALDDDTTYLPGNQLVLAGSTFTVVEGSGSGLDADLLDGQQATAFASTSHSHYALDAADGSPTEALYVDNAGEVGVGTTAPAGTLHVSNASAPDALVVLANGDVGIGTDSPYEAQFHVINEDTASGSWSSLKIGGNIPSSMTPYNSILRMRTSRGGVAILRFHDAFQGTTVDFRKEANIGSGNWFRVINRHDSAADQTIYEFYHSGSGASSNERMGILVPLGVGTSDPTEALDVVGNAHISGTLTVRETLTVGPDGYIQFPTLTGSAPPAADCNEASEAGRMVVRTDGSANLYICIGASGWITR